jgi:hypothetical protein
VGDHILRRLDEFRSTSRSGGINAGIKLAKSYKRLEDAGERVILWNGFLSLLDEFNQSFEGDNMMATESVHRALSKELVSAVAFRETVFREIRVYENGSGESDAGLGDPPEDTITRASREREGRRMKFAQDARDHELDQQRLEREHELAQRRVHPAAGQEGHSRPRRGGGWDDVAEAIMDDGDTDADRQRLELERLERAKRHTGLMHEWGNGGRDSSPEIDIPSSPREISP